MYLTSEDVLDILQLLDSLPFDELHLSTASFSLSLRRDRSGEWTQAAQVLSPPQITAPTADTAAAPGHGTVTPDGPDQGGAGRGTPGRPGEHPEEGAAGAATGDGTRTAPAAAAAEVRTPLPGTFYRAPKPGAPPFVEVGSRVGPDTVVGIIETMKLMNSVLAGTRGTVAEICLRDAEFAGQDAVLMRVEPETGPEGA